MSPPKSDSSKKKPSPYPELDELAEFVGEFIQYWGFKRIHGKIWAHLFLSEVPLDATTLVSSLIGHLIFGAILGYGLWVSQGRTGRGPSRVPVQDRAEIRPEVVGRR